MDSENDGWLLLGYKKGLDNQKRQNFYHSSYVHKGFISVVSLSNDLMKILVGLGVFNHVFFKNTNICWFKYK